jgi:thiol:disulfide interchange protein DsbD
LHSLPKSGGWLHTVKVSLGFLELALALKFLSNVDLAYHLGFLKREIFLGAWIVIFAWMGFYLIGRFMHIHKITITRAIFALLAFSFAGYLTPGLWGKPLKVLSGLPPPEWYSVHKIKETCPLDLACFHDYEEGMAYATKHGKPVMIDFTGWNCVNCRKMEENVWSDPMVLKKLREDYVLISLYVDDKQSLPPNEQSDKIKTVGNKWSAFQAKVFNSNAQPNYVLLDNHGKLLAKPIGSASISDYVSFLDEGLCRYEKRSAEQKNLASK